MFREQDNLINMPRVMQELARNRLHDAVLATSNQYLSPKVARRERSYCLEYTMPSILPPSHNIGASCRRIDLKFLVSMTIGFFSIAI